MYSVRVPGVRWSCLSLKSETPPPVCYSRRSVSHIPQASFLGWTPLAFAAVGTKGDQFVGWAERAVTILQRNNRVMNLIAFKDSQSAPASQSLVLAPISPL